MSDWLKGNIDCEQKCLIPEGKLLSRVPPPRHKWADIIRCPDCGDCFLVVNEKEINPASPPA